MGRGIIEKMAEIEEIKVIADFLELKQLLHLCLHRSDQLTALLTTTNNRNREARTLCSVPIPRSCDDYPVAPPDLTKPADAEKFYDVSFVCSDGSKICGNRLVLASRSSFFRELLADPASSLPSDLPPAFFKDWIEGIHKGTMISDTLSLVEKSDKLVKYIKNESVLHALQIAQQDNLIGLAEDCSDKMMRAFVKNPAISFTRDRAISLKVGKNWLDIKRAVRKRIPLINAMRVTTKANFGTNPIREFETLLKNYGKDLTRICFEECSWFTDAHLDLIADYCPLLQRLNLNRCTQVTGPAIEKLAAGCPLLQVLNLNRCTKVTAQAVEKLAANCPLLQVLNLNHCTEVTAQAVEKLASGCPLLRKLFLSHCTGVTDHAIEILGASCPQLQELNISWCTEVKDHSIIKLAACCPLLQRLGLSHCRKVTGKAIERVAASCPLLQRLYLDGCTKMTSQAVEKLAASCPLLHLGLRGCKEVTNQTIEILAEKCPQIEELNLIDTQVGDTAVKKLAFHCRQLQKLGISRCTDQAVEEIVKSCLQLRMLNVSNCFSLSEEYMKTVRDRFPQMEII